MIDRHLIFSVVTHMSFFALCYRQRHFGDYFVLYGVLFDWRIWRGHLV